MRQYCRHCGYLTVNNVPWCEKREEAISGAAAESPNRCHDFAYTPVDAFGEKSGGHGKGYTPRRPGKGQCDGQIKLF